MNGMDGDRRGWVGGVWDDMLDGFSGSTIDRNVIDRAHVLAHDGGRLAMAMDVIADTVRDLDRASGPYNWAYMMLADTPVFMDGNGTVPDDVPRIITMVVFSSMSMCIVGSSAQPPSAYDILPSGIGRRWGYDGPDVTPGFIRSMITDGWVRQMTESDRFEHPLPACMVELMASMTGGEAPSVYDITRAYSMQMRSDLSRGWGVSPEVSLPMNSLTLEMTDGLRDRMGSAWPVVPNMLWEDGPCHLSMSSLRFVIMAMDWKRPVPEDDIGTVFNRFLDVFSDHGVMIDRGMLSGHLLLSWAASTHDPLMMAAAPSAATIADRFTILAYKSCLPEDLNVSMLRHLVTMADMPNDFLMETMKAMEGMS